MPKNFWRLGELLVANGIITNLQLSVALAAQRTSNRRLGEIIIERGFATEEQIAQCLAQQYGYELIDPLQTNPDTEALQVVEPDFAVANNLLPLKKERGALLCAVSDPLDVETTDVVARRAGVPVKLTISPRSKLQNAIRHAYGLTEEVSSTYIHFPSPPWRYAMTKPRRIFGETMLLDSWDKELDRPVCLLAIPARLPTVQTQFELVRAAARVPVLHVCAVYDWFSHENYFWAALERLEGETLENILRTRGARPLAQAAEYVAKLAEGVDLLCQHGEACHLVCPTNVIIRENGSPKLTPFIYPPLEYQSPEEATEGKTDLRSEVFSLGTILAEAVTGSNPFRGPNREHIVRALQAPLDLDSWKIPPVLTEILKRCLSVNREKRFASPIQLTLALRAVDWPNTKATFAHLPEDTHDREHLLNIVTDLNEGSRPSWSLKNFFQRFRKTA
ncbi:MAG: protein kinase [Candidatus Caldarchaeum sp.]